VVEEKVQTQKEILLLLLAIQLKVKQIQAVGGEEEALRIVLAPPAAPASSSSATPRVKTAVLGRGW